MGNGSAGRDRRQYYRVHTRIPLRHRALRLEEADEVETEVLTPRPEPDDIDPTLSVWLRRLEHKLDLLLSHLDPSAPRPLGPGEMQSVEISASGARFASKERSPIGTDEIVEFLLPGKAPRHIRVIGRVVEHFDASAPGDEDELAIAFRVIGDEDRDAIVRFSNEVQRVDLRARGGERV